MREKHALLYLQIGLVLAASQISHLPKKLTLLALFFWQ